MIKTTPYSPPEDIVPNIDFFKESRDSLIRDDWRLVGVDLKSLKAIADFKLQIGDLKDSEKYYYQALRKSEGNDEAKCNIYYCLGRLYNIMGEKDKEIESMHNAVDLDFILCAKSNNPCEL
jgi:tetratricopeptide (TPR) repeat protein